MLFQILVASYIAGLALVGGLSAKPYFDLLDHLSTKSPYKIPRSAEQGTSVASTCNLTQLHLISRHGTRYPSARDALEFARLGKLFSKAIKHDGRYSWMSSWESPYLVSQEYQLAPSGALDLYRLSKRCRSRYHDFFRGQGYDPRLYSFLSSQKDRSGESGSAFGIGLFEGTGPLGETRIQPVYIYTIPLGLDQELAIKYACEKWLAQSRDNVRLGAVKRHFSKHYIKKTANRISEEFALNVTTLDVKYIYKLCGFEASIHQRRSTWCDLLRDDEILELELLGDFESYYKYSYGSAMNSKMACALVTKLVTQVEDHLRGASSTRAYFKFGHAETLLFLSTLLNLRKDPAQWTISNIPKLLQERDFRTSELTPFSANVFFEIYQCAQGGGTRVRLLVNERPTQIPGCRELLCSWEEAKGLLKDSIGCTMASFCSVSKQEVLRVQRRNNRME
ncbi:phosphoglycerate mutase-like protein [Basidiobolus meristosporus CBS 931.73]|uniref:Multiple inositol polyphosphate phosphatase 1 n=1 Tax=Basidiobolus meristosporus CBS 931.73 TaxID=1314790 RepID=A0A1Y1X670_9FUNG|nr:phosphoglycerate mutase-like protein [Basidiobolus meristosporus CBS 931.73]|eukprot:ORX81301.1 phosphoglycerate mutase-like protein [Basidiobolus meristosporus CBS 931.73]